jgi:hypothetical protein
MAAASPNIWLQLVKRLCQDSAIGRMVQHILPKGLCQN